MEKQLKNLIDKSIGTKGELRIHSYWMRKIFSNLLDYIPTKASQLIEEFVEEFVEEFGEENIPTKLSQLENDADYASNQEVYSLQNNVQHLESAIPTKVSQLSNDVGYIQNIVLDGVYAVTADYQLIDYNEADESCIGVAVVAGNHKFMIEKYEDAKTVARKAAYDEFGATDTNTKYSFFYWGGYKTDQTALTNYTSADGTNNYGYLGGTDTPQLSKDFTTWTTGALSDFDGKKNSEVIKTVTTNGAKVYAPMGIYLNKFNAEPSENLGKSDWYIPSCGQLALMYLAWTDINAAFAKIGGTELAASRYWSSSEYDSTRAWFMYFTYDFVDNADKVGAGGYYRVRLIRDIEIQGVKQRILDLETKSEELENQLSNVYTKSEVDAKILELQTLINNYINGTSQVPELDS